MKLLKIIIVFFLIYFIRRFIQMYKAVKTLQEQQQANAEQNNANATKTDGKDKVVEADFKVME
jgi:Na+/H+ antiporter NhaC